MREGDALSLSKGWEEVSLENTTIQFIDGDRGKNYPNQNEFHKEGFCLFLSAKNITSSGFKLDELIFINEEKDKILRKGKLKIHDIIITTRGTIGNVAIYTEKNPFKNVRINSGMLIMRNSAVDIDTNYLFQFLNSDLFKKRMLNYAFGAAVPQLPISTLRKLKINIPPLETQRKIASILSGYDDLIENNLKRIKILEEMAQQTYEEWFVRMRFPGYETAVMNEETGLPEGWEKVKIQNLCTVSGGGTPSKIVDEYWENGNINWFTPTDLSKNNSLVISDSGLKTNELGIKKSSAKVLQPNSFVMTSRATIGLFALIDKPFSTNQGFINTTPNRSNLKAYLLYNFKYRIDELMGLATGATFPELSKSKFKVLAVNKPTESVLNPFEELTNNIFKQLFNLSSQNQRLRESRDLLLPRLMMGIIEVDGLIVNEDLAMVSEESEKYNKL